MPRTERKKSKTGIYHIVLRGINKQVIFEDAEDALKFLETIKEYKEKCGYKLYAYCLMDNHIHLLLREEQEELGMIMRRIGAKYVYWYNLKYKRSGPLFQDRYKSEVIEDDSYFLTVLRYIHQNPIQAGIVEGLEDYKWSSYADYLSHAEFLDMDFVFQLFSDNREEAELLFKEFHQEGSAASCLDIEEKRRLLDAEGIEIIKKICQINCCTEIKELEKTLRNKYLKLLKEEGLSTRQITRLTGIGRSIVLKA